MDNLLVGIDFGSDSVRVLLCNSVTGIEVSTGVSYYKRWAKKQYCMPDKSQYRQHALDYIESLCDAFSKATSFAPSGAGEAIVGIAVDTTGSTLCPVDASGAALCLSEDMKYESDAMFHLWKDHTAVKEAMELNVALSRGQTDYTKYQGVYSSEWFWAKILHTVRNNDAIRNLAYTWLEHSDWIAGLLLGLESADEYPRCACGAGHKALWHSEFGGLPDRDILNDIDPYLTTVYDRYACNTTPAGEYLGNISPYWAKKLGINSNVKIGMGSFDAHAGGVGAGIERNTMVKVVGTSTVDLVIEKPEIIREKNLREVCGQAEDSIIPGYTGLEMGQPSFGDSYLWVKKLGLWPIQMMQFPSDVVSEDVLKKMRAYLEDETIHTLEKFAQEMIMNDEIALDWFNGRRYPSLNEYVKSVFTDISLSTDLPSIFCAVVKGTVFGSRRIFESLVSNGIEINKIIVVGGIAEKSSFVMQMLADVLKLPLYICRESQVCAKGAAIYAGVAAGLYGSIPEAQKMLCRTDNNPYLPNKKMEAFYDHQYKVYLEVCGFGENLVEMEELFNSL